ncbi:MAG: hypothetical protein ACF8TS_13935 [Maioricimonas sp. JB049]
MFGERVDQFDRRGFAGGNVLDQIRDRCNGGGIGIPGGDVLADRELLECGGRVPELCESDLSGCVAAVRRLEDEVVVAVTENTVVLDPDL